MRLENSFVAAEGVGPATERRLWAHGVTEWAAFDRDRAREVPGVGPTTADRIESFLGTARDRLADRDARYFDRALPDAERWRLYPDFRAGTTFLDIETTGLSKRAHEVTVVSLHRAGETTTLVRGRDLTAERLARELVETDCLVTFNGRRFDVPFLEASFGLEIDRPHIDLMYPCRRVGLTGGLKRIEREVGIERTGAAGDVDGREAVRLWRAYERGDEDSLERLVRYNRADTENLRTLSEAVTDRLHAETLGAVLDGT